MAPRCITKRMVTLIIIKVLQINQFFRITILFQAAINQTIKRNKMRKDLSLNLKLRFYLRIILARNK